MLQANFHELASRYSGDKTTISTLWKELEDAYNSEERYFHNGQHLQMLVNELTAVQLQVEDWDTLLFAVFYHDFSYDVEQYILENNNEEQSAEIGSDALLKLTVPADKIVRFRQHILATKKHRISTDGDTNFLTDADLSVLGQSWEVYQVYQANIRKEFSVYPDPMFLAGRTKVLQHFLAMDRIYKTDHFFTRYEEIARENMRREKEILSFR